MHSIDISNHEHNLKDFMIMIGYYYWNNTKDFEVFYIISVNKFFHQSRRLGLL